MKIEQEHTLENLDHHGTTSKIGEVVIAAFDRALAHYTAAVMMHLTRAREFDGPAPGEFALESAARIITEGEGLAVWEIIDWCNMATRVAFPVAHLAQWNTDFLKGLGDRDMAITWQWQSYADTAKKWAEALIDLIENSLDVAPGGDGDLHQTRNLYDISISEIHQAATACMILPKKTQTLAGEVVE